MTWVNLRTARLSVGAEVPDRVADGLRWLRRAAPRQRDDVAPADRLTVADQLPQLHLQRHNPSEALEFLREVHLHELAGGSANPSNGSTGDLAQRIAQHWWYHSIELPDGTVTPGIYDHRPLVPRYGLPSGLAGKRALDVATFDGFWAFELERRGAQVVALDIGAASELDMPPQVKEALLAEGLDRKSGDGFRVAHEALGSRVERVERSVYELDPNDIGTFDFVHMADLLLHVADPLGALQGIRRVTKGQALIVDCFDPELGPGLTRYRGGWSGGVWWAPGLDTLAQMTLDAGFRDVALQLMYRLGTKNDPRGPWRAALLANP